MGGAELCAHDRAHGVAGLEVREYISDKNLKGLSINVINLLAPKVKMMLGNWQKFCLGIPKAFWISIRYAPAGRLVGRQRRESRLS